jgi:flagellar motor component MotA
MNLSALAGITLTSAALVLGMSLGGQVERFVDIVSFLIVALTLPYLLMLTHRSDDLKTYGLGGVRQYLLPSSGPHWSPSQHLKAARIANSAGTQAMMLGAAGTLVGTIQMLQALEDPTKIGPALALAGLTLLYGLLINTLVCIPIARHHELIAIQAGASPAAVDRDPPLRTILVITALIGLSVGVCFFVMLLAMGVSVPA